MTPDIHRNRIQRLNKNNIILGDYVLYRVKQSQREKVFILQVDDRIN